MLDTMAKDLKDPLITCHLGTMNSPTRTSVKVSIVTAGYDSVLRTQLVIHVGEKQLTVVCKDGKVLHFSHEPQELRDFILCQISQHQINGVQASQRSILRSMPVAYSDSHPTLYVVRVRAKPVLHGPNSTEPDLLHHGKTTYRVG